MERMGSGMPCARYVLEGGAVRYRIERTGGDGRIHAEKEIEVCPGHGEMAVAYDEDGGVLHAHGERSRVEAWAERTRGILAAGGFPELSAGIAVIAFAPTPEALEELNACVAITGRVSRLAERLAGRPGETAARDPAPGPRR